MKRFVDGYFLINRHNLQGNSRSYVSHGTMRTDNDDDKEVLIISGWACSWFKKLKMYFGWLIQWLGMETSNIGRFRGGPPLFFLYFQNVFV